MRIYEVYRPYCSPGCAIVLAKDAEHAKELTHGEYGYCMDTKVREVGMKRGRVLLAH